MPTRRVAVGIVAVLGLLLVTGRFAPDTVSPTTADTQPVAVATENRAAPRHTIAPRADRIAPVAGPAPEFAPGQVLVRFSPTADTRAVDRIIAGTGGSRLKSFRAPGLVLVSLPDNVSVADAVAYFRRQPEVERVEEDLVYRLLDVPNDPSFGDLWGLDNTGQEGGTADVDINAPEAWIETRGSRDFIVGIVDSGIELDHPDLQPNLWTNPGEIPDNGLDDDGNGHVDDVHGIDQIGFDGSPEDTLGHGSHVAGTIAAAGNNGIGVAGVMWEADLLACKAFSSLGWTTLSRLLTCLEYFVWAKDAGFNVVAINNSWGGGGYSWALHDVIAELDSRDILFVASAGNDDIDLDAYPLYPAAYEFDNVFSVAAIDRNGARASFSNFGAMHVDIAAPGVDILSTDLRESWTYKSGTSMAAPHLTGAIGLIKASAPSLTGQEIKAHIMATGTADAALAPLTVSGRRLRLDLPFIDLDGDGLSDRWERRYGLDPADPADAILDPDADGLDNLAEFLAKTDPNASDTDGDSLTDGDELNIHATDPLSADSDGDTLGDADELLVHGTDPNVADTDGDGLSDSDEIDTVGTNALVADTDGDGLLDGFEVVYGFDPLTGGDQDEDDDGDGLTALEEQAAGTSPLLADTDGDTLPDNAELSTHGTNPLEADSDDDDLRDDWEVAHGLLPNDAGDQRLDPDGDGFTNLEEFHARVDPRDHDAVPPDLVWSGQQGNARHNGFVPIHTDVADFEQRFTTVLPAGTGEMRPAAARHGLYTPQHIAGDHHVAAYDMSDGAESWRKLTELSFNPGMLTAAGDGVFVVTRNPESGSRELLTFDRHSGAALYPAVPLLADEGARWVTVDSGQVFIQNSTDLLVLDAATGAEIWRKPFDFGYTYDSPAIAIDKQYIVTAANDRLQVFLRASGELLHDVSQSTCALGADQIALDGEGYAYLLCPLQVSRVRLSDSEVEWHLVGATSISDLAVDTRYVYVSTWETLRALDRETGNEAWSWESEPGERIDGNIIATLDHVIVGVHGINARTAAIDLETHIASWQVGLPGYRGLTGDGALVIQPEWENGATVVDLHGDRDADGLKDWWERYYEQNLAVATDAALDIDGDGLASSLEYQLGTNPLAADTDGDGLDDNVEVSSLGTDPLVADTDGDGLTDGDEINVYLTQPLDTDSDADGYHDGDEVTAFGTDPADAGSRPGLATEFAESFEAGLPADWSNGADADHAFSRTTTDSTDGAYALTAVALARFETAAIEWQVDVASGDLVFDYRVTKAGDHDRLNVYVDGVLQIAVTGNNWSTAHVALAAGRRTIRLEYDAFTNSNGPIPFIDNVRFGPAPPFGSNIDNVLAVSQNHLHEYRPDGSLARAPLAIPYAVAARDLVVLPDHRIAIADAPWLHLYDPVLNRFSRTRIEGWDFGSNSRISAIAAFDSTILLSPMTFDAIYKLDMNGVVDSTVPTDNRYVSLHQGRDGYLYGQPNFDGRYDRMDPATLATVESVWLPTFDSSGIAVNAAGEVFSLTWGRYIEKYTAHGTLIGRHILDATYNTNDLVLNDNGRLFVGSLASELMLIGPGLHSHRRIDVQRLPLGGGGVFVAYIPAEGPDSDGDLVPDWWERVHGMDPETADALHDPDGDGLTNAQEFTANGDPANADTDGDGLPDGDEYDQYGTSVTLIDTDADGSPDFDEVMYHATDPTRVDTDGDGLTDGDELRIHQSNPLLADSDGDGMPDGAEFRHYLDINDATDSGRDMDFDGLANSDELTAGTDPRNWDSDGDGLADGAEQYVTATDPLASDTDGDHMDDGWEAGFGLNPLLAAGISDDTDGDGFTDRVEFYAGSEPLNAVSVPVPEPWATDQGNVRHTGYVPVRLVPGQFSVDWSVAVPTTEEPSPLRQVAVGRRHVFVTQPDPWQNGELSLTALRRDVGDVAWQHSFGIDGRISQPALDTESVYVQTDGTDDNKRIRGIRLDDGTIRFATPFESQFTEVRAPAILDGGLFTPVGYFGGVARYDTASGSLTWYVETDTIDDGISPALDGRNVYTYSPAMSMVNVIDASSGYHGYSVHDEDSPTGGYGRASPMLGSRDNLIVHRGDFITSVDLKGRSVNWRAPVLSTQPPALANGVYYVAERNAVLAIDERTGSLLWEWPVMRSIHSNVLATVDHFFVSTDNETFAVDINSRGSVWSYPAGGQLSMSEDQVLYIAGLDGMLTSVSTQSDSDGDGVPDHWEQRFGFDAANSADATTDADSDGLTQEEEFLARTDPTRADTDDDGLTDFTEIRTLKTSPLRSDSDGDGLPDDVEVQLHRTDPLASDTDGDGLPDRREIEVHGSSPLSADSDADGYGDRLEIARGSDPGQASSAPAVVVNFRESFEGGGISPRLDNGSSGSNTWEVSSDGVAADGRNFIRPPFVDRFQVAELSWHDNFAAGILSFRVFMDDLRCCDTLEVYLDDTLVETINTERIWSGHTVLVPAGRHVIRWRFVRERFSTEFRSRTFLDQIRYSVNLDQDGDGMPTAWELAYDLNPDSSDDAGADADGDTLTNLAEYQAGTSPQNSDTDRDGMPDDWEVRHSLEPTVDDAMGDPDGDGLGNYDEYRAGTQPRNQDTDGDGIPDGWESRYALDPLLDDANEDPDGDGASNLAEYQGGTDPTNSGSTPGGGTGGGSGGGGSGGGGSGGGSSGGGTDGNSGGGSGGGSPGPLLLALLAVAASARWLRGDRVALGGIAQSRRFGSKNIYVGTKCSIARRATQVR